jgi:hypothetical protein
MTQNEIFLNDTEEMFNHTTERLMQHKWHRREELNPVSPPPPMLGNNYDVPNGLFGLKRDTFLKLAAEKHHGDGSSRQLFGMG